MGRTGEDRILTVPNVITVGRLAFLPLYVWFLTQDMLAAAAGLLAILGATDWCDGYIARHFDQVSKLGRLIDPTADRVLFFVGIGGIIAVDGAPRWFSIIVLAREVTVAAITITLLALGAKPVEVTWFGKAGTFALMFAFPLFLAGASDIAYHEVFWALGWLTGLPGMVLSFYAAFRYVPLWREAFAERGQDEATAPLG